MNYATRADLVSRFGEEELTTLEQLAYSTNGSLPTVSPVNDALTDASEEANSYIARAYALPLPSVPKGLVLAVCDIARYLLYKDRATEEVTKRYERRVSWLKDVSAGRAVLTFDPPLSPEKITESQKHIAVGTRYDGGVFSRETLSKIPQL